MKLLTTDLYVHYVILSIVIAVQLYILSGESCMSVPILIHHYVKIYSPLFCLYILLAVLPGVARAKVTSGEIVGNSQYYSLCV